MAFTHPYSEKKLLIVDDLPEMRSSLRSQVASLGFEKVNVAANVRDALELCKQARFDVILCDYYLKGSTDGQQFLEFLRTRGIISRSCLFIMITAEKNYEVVVTVAECLPDEYLLKPFTAETLRLRLDRLLEKKQRLRKVDQMQDRRQWPEVVAACEEIIAARDKYLVDALRIKGNALLMGQRYRDAAEFYRQALQVRPLPWARLGLARALHQQGSSDEARGVLEALIEETPQLMMAHDLLGHIHQESGDQEAALNVLDNACRISPHSLTRHRAIAKVAEQSADYARVEAALSKVVDKTRNSPLRDIADFARLGHALSETGASDKALELIGEAKTLFRDEARQPLFAASAALVLHKAGQPEAAAEALQQALQGDPRQLPAEVQVLMAKACLQTGQQETGEALLKQLVQNAPDATGLHAQVVSVLKDCGQGERAEQLVQQGVGEIIALNNEAVRRGQAGDLAAAAAMLSEAALRLPGNPQILANAAYALLADLLKNGLDHQKLLQAQDFRQQLLAKNPAHPRLAEIDTLLAQLRQQRAR